MAKFEKHRRLLRKDATGKKKRGGKTATYQLGRPRLTGKRPMPAEHGEREPGKKKPRAVPIDEALKISRTRAVWESRIIKSTNRNPLIPYDDRPTMTQTYTDDINCWPDYENLRATKGTPRMDIVKMFSEICR